MIRNVASVLAFATLLIGAASTSVIVLPAPAIFAPGVISGPANDGTPTFSPNGRTLYIAHYGATYRSVIFESRRTANGWSKPVVAPFSGPSSDLQPAFAPDGRSLVYVSRRKTSNLWRVVRTPAGWSAPARLPDTVNIGRSVHNPSLAANGDIYFTAPVPRPGQDLTWRLYRARFRNGRYDRARELTFSDGNPADAEEPCVAPDTSYLIFASRGIHLPIGHKHFFIALREGTSWGPVTQIRFIGDDSPSADNDAEPELSPDGATLYFNANRHVWTLPLRPLLDALRT